MQEEQRKRITKLIQTLNKHYGEKSVFIAGENKENLSVDWISTGSYLIDLITGGGIPRGRFTEIFGPESSGKTTLSLMTIAEAQKQGLVAGFINKEESLDLCWAEQLGVKIDNLVVASSFSGEIALELLYKMVESGEFGIIVVDSVASLTPTKEIEQEFGDPNMGTGLAKLMNQAMRKLVAITAKANTAVVFINQVRDNVGVMYGNKDVTPGGRALKFFSSVRLKVSKGKIFENKLKEPVGHEINVKCEKNKLARPLKKAVVHFYYDGYIDKVHEILTIGLQYNIIKRRGAYYDIYGESFQGRESLQEYLQTNPEVQQRIFKEALESGEIDILNAYED